ncbi:MAG: hypothetical protein GF404_08280 [candidate division Zixibacteria bacterium]|jgi:hypothetical protein|nr:hypothetical protein [candidate division Zixibacteria bacterium]
MEETRKTAPPPRGQLKDLVELVEEIRMTALNLAIASAKFHPDSPGLDAAKKDLTELVTTSLESVNQLTKFLGLVGLERKSEPCDDDVDHEALEENLKNILDFVQRISKNFLQARGLK